MSHLEGEPEKQSCTSQGSGYVLSLLWSFKCGNIVLLSFAIESSGSSLPSQVHSKMFQGLLVIQLVVLINLIADDV